MVTKVALLGSTGHVGAAILQELSKRGTYEVLAVGRDAAKIPKLPHVTGVSGNASDPSDLGPKLKGVDVVVSALTFNVPATTVVKTAEAAGAKRVLAVGGTGSLRQSPGGPFIVENPNFNPQFKEIAQAGLDFYLDMKKHDEIDWTILTMAASFGEEPVTGKYRIGGDTMIKDSNGESRISYADFALAMVDEVENHKYPKDHVAVAH